MGLSGGADSTALLCILANLNLKIIAVHCNFHLRGDESNRDMDFCKSLCAKLNVPLRIYHYDVHAYMKEHKVSLEEACRELRYADFRNLKKKKNYDRIAVAHNADDNIETMLLNLFRGSGIRGIRGMIPDTGEIIRPLLQVTRKEIINYLSKIGQDYIVDSSNLQSDYKRNFIRNELIPSLETRWPGIRKALNKSVGNLYHDERMLKGLVNLHCSFLNNGETFISYKSLSSVPDLEWAIRHWSAQFGASSNVASEIAELLQNSRIETGKKWKAREGWIIARPEGLTFIQSKNEPGITVDYNPESIFDISMAKLSPEIWTAIKSDRSNLKLWTSLSPDKLYVRHSRPGDRVESLGLAGSQLVSDILRDAGINPEKRSSIVVVCDRSNDKILWIPGIKRSRHHLLTNTDDQAYLYQYPADTEQ